MVAIIKHSFENRPPKFHELAVQELGLWGNLDNPRLYTKTIDGTIVEIGKGVRLFSDLEDVDLTNVQEGSFFIRQGNKYVASNSIGSISKLSDLEINNPQDGQYIRYDSVYGSFRNFNVTYSLYQIEDVDVPDPSNYEAVSSNHDKVLTYNHNTSTFVLTPRRNNLEELLDIQITPQDSNDSVPRLLMYDTEDSKWKNQQLDISKDPSPVLGGNLNANSNYILNSTYKTLVVQANAPIVKINYKDADYFIIEGVESSELESCIVDIEAVPKTGSSSLLLLEIRQKSGQIILGGLQNVHYEDGKPILLSGEGKTDIISVLVQNKAEEGGVTKISSYVTAVALNVAVLGQGGIPAFRYDKNRYPEIQTFNVPSLYDDYFDYVELLLNFEQEQSTGWLWYEDKSIYNHTVVTTAAQKAINIYTFGLQESVAYFAEGNETITVTPSQNITLDGNFTLEFFINYDNDNLYKPETSIIHEYFDGGDVVIKYQGQVSSGNLETTQIVVQLGTSIYTFSNAFRFFSYQNNRYIHIALVRKENNVFVYVDGFKATPINNPTNIETLTLNSISLNTHGHLNSVRLTNTIARYDDHFLVPDMRFGLTGGANDILGTIVDDTYFLLGHMEMEHNIFC